jgi:formate dehydrogenase iron-sulfur subunit
MSVRGREEVYLKMAKGMLVDTSICTGCKACQVACKEWNGLDPEPGHFKSDPETKRLATNFTGDSYDNTGAMSARDWRRVRFIEQFNDSRKGSRWLFMSDSCKHCTDAACMNVCPYSAIVRTEMGNVVVLQDKCQGSQNCNAACPYGVVRYSNESGTSRKCTLCNDRIHNGLGTACAKACPTGSIRFGEVAELKARADARLAQIKASGEMRVNIYGYREAKGLNVFYLLMDQPSVYSLPENPAVEQRPPSLPPLPAGLGLLALGVAALAKFRERGAKESAEEKE